MAQINSNYLKLPGSYLFAAMAKKVAAYKAAHPEADIIRLGIGDVTRPLVPAVIEAMHRAVNEMASPETFRGYGPEQGYDFLIDAIIRGEYAPRGVELERRADLIRPKFELVLDRLEADLGGTGAARWTHPIGGYFISLYVMPGCARRSWPAARARP